MLFSEIAGHNDIKNRLITSVKNKRISHALLFTGPQGNGKLALAIAFAQYISCSDKKENDACGQCPSCKKYAKLIHPDLHFVFPVIKLKSGSNPVSDDFIKNWREFITKSEYHSYNKWVDFLGAENQQAGIFAQESHEIIKKLAFKSYESEFKVMIIWMPEKMNLVAANKLLKSLEEPHEKTLFILVSENTDNILKTILSRTQLVKIPKINDEAMFDKIKEKYNFAENKISDIVQLADGNFLKAVGIINETNASDDKNFDMFAEFMRNCFTDKFIEIIEWTEKISKLGREKQKEFLVYSLRMIRENFILNATRQFADKIVYLNSYERDFSQKFNTFIHKNNIYNLTENFNNAVKNIERNGFDKLVFLNLAIKTSRLLKIKPQ